MELPKFLLGDNSQFPEDIFIVHTEYPRFIINLKDDSIEMLEDMEGVDEAELSNLVAQFIEEASEFYDKEMEQYED